MKIVEHNDPIGIYPGYRKQKAPAQQKFIEGFFKPPSVLVASARSGLVLGLRSLGFSRQDEIWVPPYLSHCLLSALTSVMMPSLAASSRTKAVLVFHQFGFIGDVGQIAKVAKRNKWAVVHDCAHSFFSSYRGQPVMSLGDFAVTSFPKTFPSVLGGAVCSQNKKFITQLQGHINSSDAKVESTFAKKAFSVLKKAKSDNLQITTLEVESVYGFLP